MQMGMGLGLGGQRGGGAAEIPADAIVDRAGNYILTRSGDYITTR